jgi:hypothetical protein
MTDPIATIHVLSTWFMVGLVAFVHCIHYPLLRDLPPACVPDYQKAHVRRTSPLIPIVMLIEAGTAIWLLPRGAWAIANFGTLAVVWLVTFVCIVPIHDRLCQRHDAGDVTLLLRWNLVRTLAWLGHGGLAVTIRDSVQ